MRYELVSIFVKRDDGRFSFVLCCVDGFVFAIIVYGIFYFIEAPSGVAGIKIVFPRAFSVFQYFVIIFFGLFQASEFEIAPGNSPLGLKDILFFVF